MLDVEKGLSPDELRINLLSSGSVCNCIVSSLTLALLGLLIFECRDYMRAVLVWVESQESVVVYLMFVLLFTLVSFPFTWGYIFLNLACGYLFGTLKGLVVVVLTATLGVAIAHAVIRNCIAGAVLVRLFNSDNGRALLAVISGPQAFKVIVFARLTPIPFGLQNTVFAVSGVGSGPYLAASMLGLLPTQLINVYLGSSLRSMEDVLTDDATATTGYIVFSVQILIGVLLMAFVVHKARAELRMALLPQDPLKSPLLS